MGLYICTCECEKWQGREKIREFWDEVNDCLGMFERGRRIVVFGDMNGRGEMISIICFGNTLCADDGAGEAVFKQLQLELKNKPEWQEDVQAIYAGNSGQRVFPYLFSLPPFCLP